MAFAQRTITVMGQAVDVNVGPTGDLPIADLTPDMDKVAAQMAWWAVVQAAAEREKIQTDARYRSWRAAMTNKILEEQKGLAEHKVKALIEADLKFLEFKEAIAIAEENAIIARGQFLAFDKKGAMLQSRGAMARRELARQGMTTPADEPLDDEDSSPESQPKMDPDKLKAAQERMRAGNAK